jgi:hypothetical protein
LSFGMVKSQSNSKRKWESVMSWKELKCFARKYLIFLFVFNKYYYHFVHVGVVVNGVCNAAILFDFAADQNYGDFVKTI